MLLIVALLVTYCVISTYNASSTAGLSEFDPEVEAYLHALDSVSALDSVTLNPDVPVYFNFNPNHLPREDWLKLGLQDWQIDMIYKYEVNGGSFQVKSDVLKMYSIDTTQYEGLKPYIQLPENKGPEYATGIGESEWPEEPVQQVVNINQANELELATLWGIGPYYADMIIVYRNELGGFHSVEQLQEVYGLDPEVISRNEELLETGGVLNKLNINTLTAKELQEHPYLDWNAAGHIVSWRNENGDFTSVEQLRSLGLIVDEIYVKIAPYLTTSD